MIETLEVRIAPAAVFVNATTATYTDVDGDLVTVKFSKSLLTPANLSNILGTSASGLGDHLDTISFTSVSGSDGTNITVSAKLAGQGNGLADVTRIISNTTLGAVTIMGDLDKIVAGHTADTATVGVKSLSVRSFGLASYLAGAAGSTSSIYGSLGALVVKSEFAGVDLQVLGNPDADGKIGSITIGGSIVSPAAGAGGSIEADGDIGSIKIAGSIYAGAAKNTGQIKATGKIGNITIGGSVHGTPLQDTGVISAGLSIGTVKIGRDLTGGDALNTGVVSAGTTLGAVTIGGSVRGGEVIANGKVTSIKITHDLLGGQFENTGVLYSMVNLGPVTIGGSVFGGPGDRSGAIVSHGNIGAVKIGGNFQGGGTTNTTNDSGQIGTDGGNIASVTIAGDAIASFGPGNNNGSIISEGTIGAVKIGGNIVTIGDATFIIRAQGSAAKPLALASLTIGGSVNHVLVLAGYNSLGLPTFGGAGIGPIKVTGNWAAGSIAAGTQSSTYPNFGLLTDTLIGTPSLVSKIASITIGGLVAGTTGGNDHFGFEAQKIGALTIGGAKIPLSSTAFDSRPLGLTGDFLAQEIAPH